MVDRAHAAVAAPVSACDRQIDETGSEPVTRKVVHGDSEYEMNIAPINAERPKAPPADPEATFRDLTLAECGALRWRTMYCQMQNVSPGIARHFYLSAAGR